MSYFINMPYVVDNPGGGDCGFYAFSIGLIDEIKKQAKEDGRSPLYDKLHALTHVDVSLEDITNFTLHRRSTDEKSKAILLTLQLSLREVVAESVKQELLDRIQEEQRDKDKPTLVEGSHVFNQFYELVNAYRQSQTPNLTEIQKFNELALSPEVQALAKQTASQVTQALSGKTDFAECNRIENQVVKATFMKDIYDGHQFKPNSQLLKGIDAVKVRGRWGTHDNLKTVAEALSVNFRVNGMNDGADIKTQPTVRLNNLHNVHWTTTVSGTPPQTTPIIKSTPSETTHTSTKMSSYHTIANKLDFEAKKEFIIEKTAERVIDTAKHTAVKDEARELLDMADDIHAIAEKAREKEAHGADLTSEELAAKLFDEDLEVAFRP